MPHRKNSLYTCVSVWKHQWNACILQVSCIMVHWTMPARSMPDRPSPCSPAGADHRARKLSLHLSARFCSWASQLAQILWTLQPDVWRNVAEAHVAMTTANVSKRKQPCLPASFSTWLFLPFQGLNMILRNKDSIFYDTFLSKQIFFCIFPLHCNLQFIPTCFIYLFIFLVWCLSFLVYILSWTYHFCEHLLNCNQSISGRKCRICIFSFLVYQWSYWWASCDSFM